jgi:Leucine rich repeat
MNTSSVSATPNVRNYHYNDDSSSAGPVSTSEGSETEPSNLQPTDNITSSDDNPKPTPKPSPAAVAVGLPCNDSGLETVSTADRAAKEAAKMRAYSNEPAVAGAAALAAEETQQELDEMTSNRPVATPRDIEEGHPPQDEIISNNADLQEEVDAPSETSTEDEVTSPSSEVPSPSPADPQEAPRPRNEPPRSSARSSTHSNPDLPMAVPVPTQPVLDAEQPASEAAIIAEIVGEAEKEEGEEDQGRRCFGRLLSRTQWAVGALLIVVLIVVGIVVSLTQKPNDDKEETEAPTMAPTTAQESTLSPTPIPASCESFPPFSSTLHFLTLQALKEPCSPQSKANSWMMQDPYLQTYSDDRKLQRFALATLYYSTGGQHWKNQDLWLSYDYDECHWFNQGIDEVDAVCDQDLSIIHLNLSGNNLNGILPVELFFFPALAVLDLSRNTLKGTAPTMFAGAKFLRRLVLSSNQLTGQFTAELGFVASNLAILQNDDNQFTGAVPGLLRLLPSLSRLNITGNQYTGSLPQSLIQLSDTLTSLEVSDNSITGGLPTELGAARNLELIDVGGNRYMKGTIPKELGSLTNLKLVDISGTGMSGGLPGDLCDLERSGQLTLFAECQGPFSCCT